MIAHIVLIISLALVLLVAFIVVQAIIKKQTLIGRPPVPVVFFVLAKMLVIVNLAFLLLKGLDSFRPASSVLITSTSRRFLRRGSYITGS